MQPKFEIKKVKKIVGAAMIASLYVVLTFVSASFGVAYYGVQLRISEALTVLPVFSPYAIPALTCGCFISNMASPLGVLDMLFGTLSTFIAAVLTRFLRNFKIANIPILAPLPPVVLGSIFIGALISFSMPKGFSFPVFCSTAFSVGLGQFIVCYGLGLPLLIIIDKKQLYNFF
ncbi:MAG: QueT transporter family protein [Eubacteriales bacterium SKADARSKE-1]|nr:QueT transporter family protein [Eubacteriales bacterium SKADARSKE-1]